MKAVHVVVPLVLIVLVGYSLKASNVFYEQIGWGQESQKILKIQLVSKLGFTGPSLLDHFREISKSSDHSQHFKDYDVSVFYDSFVGYLFGSSFKNAGCAPDDSAVARLTRNVNPKMVHSHNDYWRDIPFLEALGYGAQSVEADIWNVQNSNNSDNWEDYVLAVGHNEHYLNSESNTLDKLYTGLFLKMLDQVNCGNKDTGRYGLFYNDPSATQYLLIDFKSSDNQLTYKLLMERYLKPLIEKDYLTYYDFKDDAVVFRPITIVLTGDYPTDNDTINKEDSGYFQDYKRYIFFDALLHKLDSSTEIVKNASLYASASLNQLLEQCQISEFLPTRREKLNAAEIKCIRGFVDKAHERQLITRIWGAPEWPESTASNLKIQQLRDLNIDLLSTDEINQAQYL